MSPFCSFWKRNYNEFQSEKNNDIHFKQSFQGLINKQGLYIYYLNGLTWTLSGSDPNLSSIFQKLQMVYDNWEVFHQKFRILD